MIDAEVLRLRRLRDAALSARALSEAFDAAPAEGEGLFSRCSLVCWQIARLATGRLRAHPYLRYQQGPPLWRAPHDRAMARARSAVARYRGRTFQAEREALTRLARELDDARCLTWLPELSDSLGRSQTLLRSVLTEVACAARREAGGRMDSVREPVRRSEAPSGARAGRDSVADASAWPYLAI